MTAITPEAQWQRCLELIHSRLNEQQFSTWFSPIRFNSYDEEKNTLTVSIPSQFFFEYLEEHYRRIIHLAIYNVFGPETKLVYKVAVVKNTKIEEPTSDDPIINVPRSERKANESPTMMQAATPASSLDPRLNLSQNFKTFIEGDSNRLPRTVGISIAEHPTQQTFNPLFIYGPSGCGKTHLVNAIGVRMKELHPEKRVLYISAHLFRVQYVDSVCKNTTNDFMTFYQGIDTLIVDDVQEFAGQEKTLNTFFHIFNHLHQNGKQIIMTADRPPVSLVGIEDRMITRFKWGLLAELEAPDLNLRREILQSHIRQNGLSISENVVNFIAENVTGSVRELEGMIHSLLAYSVVSSCRIDINFAKQILRKNTRYTSTKMTPDQIIKTTSNSFHIRVADMISTSRKSNLVQGRQVAMYLLQKHTDLTASAIGKQFGGRTHATVLYGISTIENQIKKDNSLRKIIEEIEQKLQ